MFYKELEAKLKRIFDLDKVTYDQVSDSLEQECLFIEVEQCRTRIQEKKESARVSGTIRIFANSDKLPYGYLSKCINNANLDDTKDLFFFGLETNTNIVSNIVERSMSFIYFFTSQYDPNLGTITTVNISEAN